LSIGPTGSYVLAKHANPLLQTQHGCRMDGGNIVVVNGPDFSEAAVRVAWFALEHGAGLAFVALASFISNHVPHEKKTDLMKQTEAIGAGRKELETTRRKEQTLIQLKVAWLF